MLQPEQPWASNRPPTARHWIESAVVAVRTDPRDCSQSFMQAHQSSADESSLDPHPADRSGRLRRYWQWCRRPLAALFLLAVIVLIVHYGASIEWRKVWESIRKIDRTTLLIAAGCAAGSHLVYACTDLFARSIFAGRVSAARSMAIAFVCYAFNLNLGSWVGSIGFRYRLYTRSGLGVSEITKVIGLSLITNWSGYLLLAGLAFALRWVRLPPSWELGTLGLQVIGIGMLAILGVGLALSAFSRRREWSLFGRTGSLPSIRMVLGQVAVSSCNWLLIVGVLYVLLRQYVDYPTVLAVFALAAIAGSAAHVPGGLGVTEGVFFALLGGRIPHPILFAALFTYRALYYLVPLAMALLAYLLLESGGKTRNLPLSTTAI
jgi:uncharacterized membrane protein YbhN (UPF0104 family)